MKSGFCIFRENANAIAHREVLSSLNVVLGINAMLKRLRRGAAGDYSLSDADLHRLTKAKAYLDEAAADVAAILDAQTRTDRSTA